MQLIQPTHSTRPTLWPVVLGTLVGGFLLVGGIGLSWLAFATPVVRGLAPAVVRPTPDQMIVGALIWGLWLVAPPCFAIVGAIRLSIVATTMLRPPNMGAIMGAIPALGDEYVVAASVRLSDGRPVRNVVIGPFGVAVIGELPAPSNLRRQGSGWEVRRFDGRWVSLQNPLEGTARDAERLRHWIASEERDFVVKVYAAVVVRDTAIIRTPACAAIAGDQIPAWLASLPPQRSFSADRCDDVVERIRSIA